MRIKDFTDTIRHLTDPFNIPEARRMIAENPALTQEQFKAGGIVEPGVTHYGDSYIKRTPAQIKLATEYKKFFPKVNENELFYKIRNKKVTSETIKRLKEGTFLSRSGMDAESKKKQKKLDQWLKNKKQVSSTELTKKLTDLGYESPTSKMYEMKQNKSKWFKKTKFIQDPNPMLTGELRRGVIDLSKGQLTVANKYAQLFNSLSPDNERYVSSSNYADLPSNERAKVTQVAGNNDWVFRKDYSRQLRFSPAKEKILMDMFGLTEQDFLKHGKFGVPMTLENGKRNPQYSKIHRVTKQGFKFSLVDSLKPKVQIDLMNNFELPEGVKEWDFKYYKYGVPGHGGENAALVRRMVTHISEKEPFRMAADWATPKGWMMNSMHRAWENKVTLPNGKLAYDPKYATINGKRKIIGFTDHTAYGKGKTYYGLKKWNKLRNGADWAEHADFKKTSKFVDIARRAYAPPNEVIAGLLEKGGIPQDGRFQLNHVLKFLAKQEGYDISRIKNAIVKHHVGGVGAGKTFGSPTNDLQILRYTVNDEIKGIERRIRRNNILPDDVTTLKNVGDSVRGSDGRLYGAGSRTPIGGFKAIEKYAEEKIGKWKPEEFKKFKTYIKQIGCPGRLASQGGGDVDCFALGKEKIKAGNIKTPGEKANFSKLAKIAGGAKKLGAWLFGPVEMGTLPLLLAGEGLYMF